MFGTSGPFVFARSQMQRQALTSTAAQRTAVVIGSQRRTAASQAAGDVRLTDRVIANRDFTSRACADDTDAEQATKRQRRHFDSG